MTGPEHYEEAERLLDELMFDDRDNPNIVAAAQAHATLAFAAATALNFGARVPHLGKTPWDEVLS